MPTRRGHDEQAQKTHIPRPPNAFILFRSSFIRNEHVPGKVEGNHSTLSKIIGLCWKDLSPQERRYWEDKAREAQTEHRRQYPDWRWTPEANALGKKRASKSRKQQDGAESSSPDDPSPTPAKRKPERKSKGKDKGKARDRSHDPDEVDEDARVAKIADLLKQGKTGPQLQSALEEWKATLAPADTRPAKRRRTGRKHGSASSVPPPSSRSALDAAARVSPRRSPPPAGPPSSPPLESCSEPPQALRRSPSGDADPSRLPAQSASLISHDPSHTPSPTVALYPSHPPVPATQSSLSAVSWPDNASAPSYPASQPPYPHWWSSSPSATPSSPFPRCYESPPITTDGLGYEEGTNVDKEYLEFDPLLLSRPHDSSEGSQWSRNVGRTGLCTVINDPLTGCDGDSPPATSSTAFPPPVDVSSSPIVSSIDPSALRHSPTTATFIPSTYSSLMGWAGEYDPSVPSPSPAILSDWLNPSWPGSVRTPSPWRPESDIPDNSRSSPHNKMPYQVNHQPSLRLPLLPSSSIDKSHQLEGSTSPSSVAP